MGTVAGGLGDKHRKCAGADLNKQLNLGVATDAISNFPAASATSGIGLLRRTQLEF